MQNWREKGWVATFYHNNVINVYLHCTQVDREEKGSKQSSVNSNSVCPNARAQTFINLKLYHLFGNQEHMHQQNVMIMTSCYNLVWPVLALTKLGLHATMQHKLKGWILLYVVAMQRVCDHLPAACLQRWDIGVLMGFPPCLKWLSLYMLLVSISILMTMPVGVFTNICIPPHSYSRSTRWNIDSIWML